MNIIVTGANGQLAHSIMDITGKYPNEYFFMDRDSLDITNESAVKSVIDSVMPHIVINCAAYTKVDMAEDEPELAFAVNCKGAGNLAKACAGIGALLVHISTDYVFGGAGNTPYNESSAVDPLGVYGESKYEGELAIEASGCNYIIIRTSWLYSIYGSNFLKTMLNLMSTRSEVKVVFDQVGTPTDAHDLADAIVRMVSNGKYRELSRKDGRIEEIFHFSNEGVCSWFDFAMEVRNDAGLKCSVKPCHSFEFPSKVTRPAYSVLDKTKYYTIFGYEIPYWRDSVCKTVLQLMGKKQ